MVGSGGSDGSVVGSVSGLQVNRFSFSSEDDFVGSLLQNQVQLFLTTDGNEVLEASQKGLEGHE